MTRAGLASLLPLTVAIPIAGAVMAPLAAKVSRKLPLLVSLACLVGDTVVLALMAPTVYGGTPLTHFMGKVVPVHGKALGIAFTADAFGLTYALVVTGIGALLLLH